MIDEIKTIIGLTLLDWAMAWIPQKHTSCHLRLREAVEALSLG